MSDADPTMPYVASSSYIPNKDRSPTIDSNNPTGGKNTSAEAMAANMAAFKQKFGRAGNSTNPATKSGYSAAQLAAAHQRNVAAGSATVNSYVSSGKTASDKANEAAQQAHADSKSSAPKTSSRPKARPKKKTTKRYSGSGGFFDRAEGGLIQKPTTTKKPAKAKTKKRGLAARK